MYTFSLCVYYLHAIKYNTSDQEFGKETEPKLHFVAIVYPLATSLLFLFTNNINAFPDGHLCFIFEEPYGCNDNDELDCTRGSHAFILVTFLSFAPVMLVCIGMSYALGSLCHYVLKQEKRNNRRLRQSMVMPPRLNTSSATPRNATANMNGNSNAHSRSVSIGSIESRRRLSLASLVGFVRRNSCAENNIAGLSRASSERSNTSRRRLSLLSIRGGSLAGRRNRNTSEGDTDIDNRNSSERSGRRASLAPMRGSGNTNNTSNDENTSGHPASAISQAGGNTERIRGRLSVVSNVTSIRSSFTSFRGSVRDPITSEENTNPVHNSNININTNVNVASIRSSVSSLRGSRRESINTTPNSTTSNNTRRGSVFSHRSNFSALRNTSASRATSTYRTRGEKIAQRRRQQTMIQALLYVGCYFFIYTLPLISHFAFYQRGVTQPIVLTTIEHALFPIGGMFNILIYTRPRVSTLQRRQKLSWIMAFYEVIKAGGDLPKNYRRRPSRRRSSQNSNIDRSDSQSLSRHRLDPTPSLLQQGQRQRPNPPSRRVSFVNQTNRRPYPYQYFIQNPSNNIPQSASMQHVSTTENHEDNKGSENDENENQIGKDNEAENMSIHMGSRSGAPMRPIHELQGRESSLKKLAIEPDSSDRNLEDGKCDGSVVDNASSGSDVVGEGEDQDEVEAKPSTLNDILPHDDIEMGLTVEALDGNASEYETSNRNRDHCHSRLDPCDSINDEDYELELSGGTFDQIESMSNNAMLDNDLGFECECVDSQSDNSRG